MGLRSKLVGVAVIMVPAAIVGVAPDAGAVATRTVALYQMNEAAGSTVLVDSSGNNLHGAIGSEVIEATVVAGATAHRFDYLKPNTPPTRPGHLDTVSSSSKLDPGTSEFAVTMRVKWTHNFGNMIQKGQAGGVGGYWKWEAPNGIVRCLFRDANNLSKVVHSQTPLNDGKWHTIRCERTKTGAIMTVDGVVRARAAGATGSISNTKILSIAGKTACDQVKVTCDYFAGDIDWVRIEKG